MRRRETTPAVRVLAATALAATTLAGVVLLAGCGSSRGDARDEFRDQLVAEGGLDPAVADCVVDRFFEGRTNRELNDFFERDALTADERAEFARLGEECSPPTT